MMTIPEIFKALETYPTDLPREALESAIAQRESITPELLCVVEKLAANPIEAAQRDSHLLPVLVLYLLAQFREKRAYPAMVRMFSAPGETSYKLVGDTVTEGLPRLFAAVYDGNPTPLHELIENRAADEYVRDSAIRALMVLEQRGQISRGELIDYFRSLFLRKLEREHSFVWNGLVAATGDMPAPELLEEVRQAYAEGLVDDTVVELEEIERDMAAPKLNREGDTLITDIISEIEGWGCFQSRSSGPRVPAKAQEPKPLSPQPTVSQKPQKLYVPKVKIGRNEPCPCGSGKKYKKCCGKG